MLSGTRFAAAAWRLEDFASGLATELCCARNRAALPASPTQDTVTGFLLAGVGQRNRDGANFLVVDASECAVATHIVGQPMGGAVPTSHCCVGTANLGAVCHPASAQLGLFLDMLLALHCIRSAGISF